MMMTIEMTRAMVRQYNNHHHDYETWLTKYMQIDSRPRLVCYISQDCKDQLNRHQGLCLRLIFPAINSYTKCLEIAKVSKLNSALEYLSTKYVM